MTLTATKMGRCALAAALGGALLAAATPGLARDQLAEFGVEGSQATWMPNANLRYDHMVLKLFVSPENEQVCCDDPVGPDGVTVDLSEIGEGAYKYELRMVPIGVGKRAAASASAKNRGPDDENGRPAGASQGKAQFARRGPVQSGYFIYPLDRFVEE